MFVRPLRCCPPMGSCLRSAAAARRQCADMRVYPFIFYFFLMDLPAFFLTVFVFSLLLSVTGYSIYLGFGPPATDLRDPFDEHEE